ncbi:plexin-A4-like [Ruditapes philippinarum]|uniref:plexin-A4-like n=1 Tax=Ruditapes philippinarum TaxID=129788 RepID=UPI00295B7E85|nr:plexin-A4-like [Ruditapes philippinarum]
MISVIIFYCVHIFLSISGMTYNKRIMQTEPLSAPLTSFLLYKGDLYVGGANKIYILDKDLEQIQIANTCETAKGVCSKNINKILLAHHSERFQILVSCGTGNSGVCEARNLSNIESVLWSSSASHEDTNYLTVSTNKNRPAVGLITENGTFFVALTFGEGVHSSGQDLMKGIIVNTYNYAISSRELNHFLPVTKDFSDKLLKVKISSVTLEEYLIYYKVCFQHDGMSYFVTNQKSEVGSSNYVTKLVRICQDDQGFYSYTDIVLNCNHFGVTYNLIQDVVLIDSEQYFGNNIGKMFIAVFTRGNNPEQPSGDSVVCVTEIQKLNDALDFAQWSYISSCNGPGNESIRYLHAYKKAGVCQNENKTSEKVLTHDDLVCGTTQTYSNAIGNDPVNIQAYFFTSEVSGILTTLAGATYENKPIILFGTSTGILIQTVLWKNFSIIENYKLTVDPGHEIKKIYATGEETIYVMSSERVIKYATTNCSEFKSCEHLVKVKHPLCGWCVYKERATRRNACFNDSRHWIPSFGNCLSMSLEPHALPLSIVSNSWNTSVKIRIPNIPVKISDDPYICLFSLQAYIKNTTNAVQLDNTTFSCLLPNISVTGNVKIKLLVKTQTGFEATLSSASLLIYECRQYKRCMECIDTKFVQCNWCGQDASCQELKSGCPRPISISRKCPQLLDKTDNFLPLGTKTMASFRITNALNLTEVIYRCTLPTSESVMATLNDDLLSCPLQVMNIGKENKKGLKIVITYGPRIERLAEIDDPFANSVTVYRCKQMALDCSHCQALNKSRYSCYWDTNNECVHNGATRVSICQSPNITKVYLICLT